MVPTDKFYTGMHEKLDEEEHTTEDSFQSKMEPLGFETVWFLSNLGSIIVILGIYLLLLTLLPLMSLCISCCPRKRWRKSLMRKR